MHILIALIHCSLRREKNIGLPVLVYIDLLANLNIILFQCSETFGSETFEVLIYFLRTCFTQGDIARRAHRGNENTAYLYLTKN
jgi:hypothetical protein